MCSTKRCSDLSFLLRNSIRETAGLCDLPLGCLKLIAEPANKMTLSGSDTLISYIESHHYRSGVTSLKVMDEFVLNVFFCLDLKQFSPFNEVLNEIVMGLIAAGIFDHDQRNFVNPKRINRAVEKDGPQVLTMDHLLIGFQVCFIPLTLSLIVFIFELVIPRLKKPISSNVTKLREQN